MNVPIDIWNGSRKISETMERIDKENARRGRLPLVISIVALVFSALALWPVVKEWLH